jgi:hypothetical protein
MIPALIALFWATLWLTPALAQPLNNKTLAEFILSHEMTNLRRSQFDTDAEYLRRMRSMERSFVLRFRPPAPNGEPLESVAQYQLDMQKLTLTVWSGDALIEQNELFDDFLVPPQERKVSAPQYQLAVLEQHVEKKPPVDVGRTKILPRRLVTPAVLLLNQKDWPSGLRATFHPLPPAQARGLARHIEFRLYGRVVAHTEPPLPKWWPERWVLQRDETTEVASDEVKTFLIPARLEKVEFVDTRTGKVQKTLTVEDR